MRGRRRRRGLSFLRWVRAPAPQLQGTDTQEGLVRRTRRKAVCFAGEVPEGYVFGPTGSFGSTTGCDAEGTLGSRNVVTVYGSQ